MVARQQCTEKAYRIYSLLVHLVYYWYSLFLFSTIGCDINMVHSDGRQPIHHSAIYGEAETTNLLLQKDIDPNILADNGSSALLLASIEGHLEVVKSLIEHKAELNRIYFDAVTAVSIATTNKKYDVMRELLSAGANPDLIGPKKILPVVECTLNRDFLGVAILLQGNASLGLCKEPEPDEQADGSQENKKGEIIDSTHPLHVAIVKNYVDLIYMLLSVEDKVNFVRYELKQGAVYYFVDNDEVLDAMSDFASSPPSLQVNCRAVIRACLGFPLLVRVQCLSNLPQALKNYILMEDLSRWAEKLSN